MNNSPEDNCPGGSLVEGNVLVEGNDVVQSCPAQQGDEVPAYREQYEGDIHVEDEGGSPSDSESVSKHGPRIVQVIVQLVVNEAQAEDEEMKENPDEEKQTTTTLVDHPDIPFVEESVGLVRPLGSGTNGVRALKGLQTPPFGLVPLEMTGLGSSVGIILEVRMLVQVGNLAAVRKVEAGGSLELAEVDGHRELWNSYGTS